MANLWRVDPSKGIKIREPDDYLERKEKPSSPPEQPGWVVNILQPAVIGVMVACISQSISQLMHEWAPGWRNHFFLIAPILAALAGYATYQTIQKRFLGSNESLRFQIFELVLIFLLCKLSTHLDNTVSEIIKHAQGWFADPKTFFDGETILMFVLSLVAWFSSAETAKDLYYITDPTLYIGEKSPMRRLSTRFFVGGLILLITTAFARVRFMDILQSDHPRVPGLILNILIYFLFGLFILGQLNYLHHTGLWRSQRVQYETSVGMVWLRYSLLFLLIVVFISFLLPTGYTVGLLDLVRFVINIVLLIVNFIFFILSYPFLLLISLLFPNSEAEVPPPQRLMPIERPEIPAVTAKNDWWEIVRSVLFWVIALVALGYVIRGYFRDRPNLLDSLQKIKPLRWIISLLKNISLLWKRLQSTVIEAMPRIINRLRRKGQKSLLPDRHQRGSGFRDRIIFIYLKTLDVAKTEGIPRTRTKTPYEYTKVLEANLSENSEQIDRLTDIFVEARYSQHDLNIEKVGQSETDAKSIQDALHKLKENKDGFEIS